MVAKCANPDCEHNCHRAGEGTVYVLQVDSREQTFWLCTRCTAELMIILGVDSKPILIPRLTITGSPANHPMAESRPAAGNNKEEGGDNGRVAESVPGQTFLEWTVDWLESSEGKPPPPAHFPAPVRPRSADNRGPGVLCQRSGVHAVIHHRHRPAHQAIIHEGEVFPPCRRCGTQVSFEFLQSLEEAEEVEHIGYDRDFIESVWGLASGGRA